jgi:putative addiction module component (TIGR02574 family)
MSLADIPQLASLTAEEKLHLIGELWDSITVSPQDLPVSEAERQELEKRWTAHQQNPGSSVTAEQFKQLLQRRL